MSGLRFAIIGAGGVGGFFGAQLHKGGVDVRFLARGKHYEAIKRNGLTVLTGGTTIRVPATSVTDSPSRIGTADVVLFCVKSYDTESAAREIAPALHDRTVIISLQNGVQNEEVIQKVLPTGMVFGGVAYIYATITEPGTITEWGGPKKIVFGPLRKDVQQRDIGMNILQAMTGSGIDAEYTDDIQVALWSKFIFITAVGGITALTRLTLGQILNAPETHDLLRSAMLESLAVATAAGITVPPTFVDDSFARLAKFDNNSRSSLYVDLAGGRRMEIDALSGTIVRFGQRYGVPTPIHSLVYAALVPHHRLAMEHAAQKNH